MATKNIVETNDLGAEFDVGVLEAQKIHVSIGAGLKYGTGYSDIEVDPAALPGLLPATTNVLSTSGTNLTSTVDGVASTVDLKPLVQNAETLTTLNYAPATKTLTYVDEDGVTATIDLSALALDIFVNGGTFNAATMVLTLTDNNATTPDIVVDLSDLKKVVTANSATVKFTGTGEASSPLTASVALDPALTNLVTATASGLLVDSSAVTALATVDVQDSFGNHLFYAFP